MSPPSLRVSSRLDLLAIHPLDEPVRHDVLEVLGLVERVANGHQLGIKLFELGERVPRKTRLREAALPFMQDLFEATHDTVHLGVLEGTEVVYRGEIPYANTFGDVPEGAPLLYLNSLMNVSFALNMGDFAKKHAISYGGEWSVRLEKIGP